MTGKRWARRARGPTLRPLGPLVIGVASACAVLALGLFPAVHAVSAALVTVVSTSANPVAVASVDPRVAQSFNTRVYPSVYSSDTITVPAGKKLVITGVTGYNNGNGTLSDIEVDVRSNGVGTAQRIPFVTPQSPSALRFLAAYEVFMVADAGSTIYLFADDSNPQDFAGVNIDVRGYYVPAN